MEGFPYSNYHDLNLDWVLKQLKALGLRVDAIEKAIEDQEPILEIIDMFYAIAYGTDRNGDPLPDTSEFYHNNCKYFMEVAELKAREAGHSASAAAQSVLACQAAQAECQRILNSIPEDYTQLSQDVSDLKSAFHNLAQSFIGLTGYQSIPFKIVSGRKYLVYLTSGHTGIHTRETASSDNIETIVPNNTNAPYFAEFVATANAEYLRVTADNGYSTSFVIGDADSVCGLINANADAVKSLDFKTFGYTKNFSSSSTVHDYNAYLKTGNTIYVSSNASNSDNITVFLYRDNSTYINAGVVKPGETLTYTLTENFRNVSLYTGGSTTFTGYFVVYGAYAPLEIVNIKTDTAYNFVTNVTTAFSTSSTSITKYISGLERGKKITVYSESTNQDIIYVFGVRDDNSTLRLSAIGIGSHKTVELTEHYKGITVYHDRTTAMKGSIVINNAETDDLNQPLFGQVLATIGDSYCATGQWQSRLSLLSGVVFDQASNRDYSVAGTGTIGLGECGQKRALTLVKDKKLYPDIIIVENVNDASASAEKVGSVSDSPYMMSGRTNIEISGYSRADAVQYFKDNIATVLDGVTPEHGYCVGIPYNQPNSTKITFASGATATGYFTINYGTSARNINVTSGESISAIISTIIEYNWDNFDVTYGADYVMFAPIYVEGHNITVTVSNTENVISASVASGQTGSVYAVYTYPLHDMTGFLASTNWVDIGDITLWSAYKGLFAYLAKSFPNAVIYLMHPVAYNVDTNSSAYQYPDGQKNTDAIRGTLCFTAWKTVQKEIADYCMIPFLDLSETSCITPQNVNTYFPANNYHPNSNGYIRWGEAVYQLLR